MKRLIMAKDRQKELEKIQLDEIKNYKTYEEEVEPEVNQEEEDFEKNYQKQLEEDRIRGQKYAEETAQKYNLSNSHNADSIQDPYLREYVQSLLSYYNSWGEDDGYTKYCERRLDNAAEALYQHQQSEQK